MKVLILGGSGMLGHKLWQTCAARFDTWVTFRREFAAYADLGIFDESRALRQVRAEEFESVGQAIATVEPELVINCIGIVKQDAGAKDPVTSITVNSLFPQRLSQLCSQTNTRVIHLSTDCVFSGRKGNYAEVDAPDAEDLYGRTKLLGEVTGEGCLTIRTSMIGRELQGAHGLLEWFLSQRGQRVRGFKRAIFSGFTTLALAELVAEVAIDHPKISGVWHMASEPISKFDLLSLIKQTYGLDTEIEPDETFECDRSLNGSRFGAATGIKAPGWQDMIQRMHADLTPYNKLRRADAS
jgi:dTDP-4-dehydrorhamnose reductase